MPRMPSRVPNAAYPNPARPRPFGDYSMREYSPGQNEGDALGYSPYLGDYYRSLADYPNLYQRNYAPARPLGTYLPGYGLDPRTNDSGIRKTSAQTPAKVVLKAMLERAGSAGSAVASAARDTQRALSDIGYNIRDRTSSKGFVPGMQPMLDAMRQAAADAGLSRLEVVAGKGQGHLSHAHGTEADIVGYNADGSKWSKAQRVAVARGASTAGGNRFGFYSGPTLHVGLGYAGSPHNVVWNNKLRGVPGVTTFAPEEQGFVTALRTGKLASYAPRTIAPAQAYTPTVAPTTPALRAAARQSYGAPNPQVAQMQRDLNSRGAQLKVDGLRGPLTRAAEQQFMGSPTSVRTPSFTNRQSYTSGRGDEGIVPRAGVVPAPTPYLNNPYTPAPATPRTPYLNNPYTSSTGGSIKPDVRQVPTQSIKAQPFSGAQLPSYRDNIDYPNAMQEGARRVPTISTGVPVNPVGAPGVFNRPAIQTPYLNNPYTMSTGGANAIVQPVQTARMPQPRPAYPPPSAPVASGPTLMQQLQDQARRIAAVAAQVGAQAKDAVIQGTRSGMGYQGGGGYTGGSYGGAGGRSIASGVGGAFRNR